MLPIFFILTTLVSKFEYALFNREVILFISRLEPQKFESIFAPFLYNLVYLNLLILFIFSNIFSKNNPPSGASPLKICFKVIIKFFVFVLI